MPTYSEEEENIIKEYVIKGLNRFSAEDKTIYGTIPAIKDELKETGIECVEQDCAVILARPEMADLFGLVDRIWTQGNNELLTEFIQVLLEMYTKILSDQE